MNIYPRSFLRLILLGNGLVALPLLVAIGYAVMVLQELANRSDANVQQVALVSQLGWEVPEELTHMERTLRQYAVLGDATLIEDYIATRQEWRHSIEQYSALPMFADIGSKAKVLSDMEAVAFDQYRSGGGNIANLHAVVVSLKERISPLMEEVGQRLAVERHDFRTQTDNLRDRLVLAQLFALGAAILLVWYWRRLLARLLRQLEYAILALGAGRLEQRIHINGPEDMRRYGRRLDWLRRRLRSLEEQRTLVLRHVSHELKTPLAALREGASLLTEGVAGALTPEQEKIAEIMSSNVLRLQTLIDNLLKLQQAGFAGNRFDPQPVRLDEMISQTLKTHQLAARKKRLHITGTLAPLLVEGGQEELLTLVDNLIANAIKFSPERGQVQISLTRQGESVVLDVADAGPGIPEVDRPLVFEPFYRGKASRGVAGAGLGLAIAREYALAHKGTLEVMPAEVGAHLRATLPQKWSGVT